jgi:fructosamine-3-kinase
MWHHIQQAICAETGLDFTIASNQQVHGGDINQCFHIADQRQKQQYFVKINSKSKLESFITEANCLQQLAKTNSISVPKVILVGTSLEFSYLILSYHVLIAANAAQWFSLGVDLAKLHLASSQKQFGWPEDNYLGGTLQPNQWHANWRTFFVEQRIAWQLQLLQEKSITFGNIEHILAVCHQVLQHHQVSPSLVHGDLWSGNVGFTRKTPMLFDPACYYGDREVDIAMTELFEPFPVEFYQGYQEQYPLPESYQQRKLLYNFYHILNHCNLFAGNYIKQANATLSRLIALT